MKEMITKKKALIAFAAALLITVCSTFLIGNSASFVQNVFWINLTYTGDAFFGLGAVLFLLFFLEQKELSLRLMVALVLTLIMVQTVKNISFGNPVHLYFEQGRTEKTDLYSGIISSHTAIAFTLAAFFTYYYRSNMAKFLFFGLAGLVAVSRLVMGGENAFSIAIGIIPAVLSLVVISQMSLKKPAVIKKYRSGRRNSGGLVMGIRN